MCNGIVRIRIDEEHRSNAAFRLTKIESGDGAKAVWLAADPWYLGGFKVWDRHESYGTIEVG